MQIMDQNAYAGPRKYTVRINTRGGRTVRETCRIKRAFRKPNRKGKTIKETCSNPRKFKKSNVQPIKTIEDVFADVLKKPKPQFNRVKAPNIRRVKVKNCPFVRKEDEEKRQMVQGKALKKNSKNNSK